MICNGQIAIKVSNFFKLFWLPKRMQNLLFWNEFKIFIKYNEQ